MSVSNFSAAPSNASNAAFRLWGSGLSAAFAAVGLINMTPSIANDALAIGGTGTDTLTWSNITAPSAAAPSAGSITGYEIWRFNDGGLQTSCPVYFKIQYGSVASSASNPGITIQVGQGMVAGTGTLTGTLSTAELFGSNTNNASAVTCYVSGDGGRINVAMFVGSVNCWAFYIERPKDDTGTPTSAGVNIVVFGSAGGTGSVVGEQYLPLTGAVNPSTPMTSPMCAMPSGVTGATYGANLGLFPIYPNLGYADNPDLGALVYFTGDIGSNGTVIGISIYSTTHYFITLGVSNGPATASLNGNTTSHSLAMRYE